MVILNCLPSFLEVENWQAIASGSVGPSWQFVFETSAWQILFFASSHILDCEYCKLPAYSRVSMVQSCTIPLLHAQAINLSDVDSAKPFSTWKLNSNIYENHRREKLTQIDLFNKSMRPYESV